MCKHWRPFREAPDETEGGRSEGRLFGVDFSGILKEDVNFHQLTSPLPRVDESPADQEARRARRAAALRETEHPVSHAYSTDAHTAGAIKESLERATTGASSPPNSHI